jgi:hypothetical protein
VTSVLARAADDETRHYEWALETLSDLGVTPDTMTGRAERAFEVAHARAADVMESAERQAMQAAQRAGRTLRDDIIDNPIGSALLAVGVGFVAATLFGGARSLYHPDRYVAIAWVRDAADVTNGRDPRGPRPFAMRPDDASYGMRFVPARMLSAAAPV